MVRFEANWLHQMLTPDIISHLIHLTRLSVDTTELLAAWLGFWTSLHSLTPRFALSDKQRAGLEQTLKRAFEIAPKCEVL